MSHLFLKLQWQFGICIYSGVYINPSDVCDLCRERGGVYQHGPPWNGPGYSQNGYREEVQELIFKSFIFRTGLPVDL